LDQSTADKANVPSLNSKLDCLRIVDTFRFIVTPDEIGDSYKLRMEARVNGEVWSQGLSDGMLFSFEEIIAHVSSDETLMPGEFIGSGTVGNGCGLELGRYLEHGDVVELEVERIGVLRNTVERQ
jgi:2-keto-4-pentenoate hydratase/2-oxohepta-3-ene-1,7-dioic acid hydratase in catechol pathway